jgi:hypothetical protein
MPASQELTSRPWNPVRGGSVPGGPAPDGSEPGGPVSGGSEPGESEPGGSEPGGSEPGGSEPGGSEPGPGGLDPGGPELAGPLPGDPGPDLAQPWAAARPSGPVRVRHQRELPTLRFQNGTVRADLAYTHAVPKVARSGHTVALGGRPRGQPPPRAQQTGQLVIVKGAQPGGPGLLGETGQGHAGHHGIRGRTRRHGDQDRGA